MRFYAFIKQSCVIVALATLSQLTVIAQVDEIKDRSDKNKEARNKNHNDSNPDYGYYDDGDGDETDNCFSDLITDCCTSIISDIISDIVSDISADLWDQKEEKPRIGSADFIGMAGISFPDNGITVPRFRYNAAIYSTDLRLYTNYEGDINEISTYTTLDWQILMFNLVILDETNFRIGTGILYEPNSNIVFNEHTAILDIYPNESLKFNLEYRITPDYKTKTIVRNEVNAGVYYKVAKWKRSHLYVFANYMGSEYYQAIWLNQAAAGVQFTLY
ncbi:MAG: hypothetical protein JXB49_03540 [Bacteroidales bacterium]|nr:hypothetical protein [Bacteroidales bacterium]